MAGNGKATTVSDFHGNSHVFSHYFFAQSMLITLVNACCFYFVLSRKSLRRRCSTWLMVSLLFSHMLMGSAFMVYYVSTSIKGQQLILVLYLYKLREVAFVATFIFITILSLDRYFETKRPFLYATLTWRYPLVLVVFGFLAVVGYFFFIVSTVDTDSVSSCIISVATASVLSATNYTIYNDVKKQANKIFSTVVTDSDEQRMNSLKRVKERHLTSLKVTSAITLSFVLLWLPYFIMVVLGACKFLSFTDKAVVMSYHASVLFGGFNSIVDPLLYIILHKKEILKELNCSRTTVSTNANREDSGNSVDYDGRTMESNDYNYYESSWI